MRSSPGSLDFLRNFVASPRQAYWGFEARVVMTQGDHVASVLQDAGAVDRCIRDAVYARWILLVCKMAFSDPERIEEKHLRRPEATVHLLITVLEKVDDPTLKCEISAAISRLGRGLR